MAREINAGIAKEFAKEIKSLIKEYTNCKEINCYYDNSKYAIKQFVIEGNSFFSRTSTPAQEKQEITKLLKKNGCTDFHGRAWKWKLDYNNGYRVEKANGGRYELCFNMKENEQNKREEKN